MADFTLDTSGSVTILPRQSTSGMSAARYWYWSDLDPFTQGYIEALLTDLNRRLFSSGGYTAADFFGFRHLAPEALALILKDCAHFTELFGEWPLSEHGKHFWLGRQMDKHPDFPPLTVYLGDDGKVHLREAA